jgi:mono/diheme cytochrome c family protein
MRICTLVVVALLIGMQPAMRGQAPAAPQGAAAGSGNAENGKKLYRAKGCWQCHNPEAQGGEAPRLAPIAMTLPAFTAYIRHPKGVMPPYLPRVLSDTDVADVYAFLRSGPKPTPASSIPLLNN